MLLEHGPCEAGLTSGFSACRIAAFVLRFHIQLLAKDPGNKAGIVDRDASEIKSDEELFLKFRLRKSDGESYERSVRDQIRLTCGEWGAARALTSAAHLTGTRLKLGQLEGGPTVFGLNTAAVAETVFRPCLSRRTGIKFLCAENRTRTCWVSIKIGGYDSKVIVRSQQVIVEGGVHRINVEPDISFFCTASNVDALVICLSDKASN